MRAAGLQELEEMTARLLALARKLPPGQQHHDIVQQIGRFRVQIAALKGPDLGRRFGLQPQLHKSADQIMRCLAIFLNGSLNVFALRRTAKVVRFKASAIVPTLFALRTSARSFLSCSGVQGARGVPFISPSPSALQSRRPVQSSRREPAKLEPSL